MGQRPTGGRIRGWLALAVALVAFAVSSGLVGAAPASAALAAYDYDTAAYTYDDPVLLSSPDTAPKGAWGSPPGPGATSWASPVSSGGFGDATNTGGDAGDLYRGLAADHPGLGDAMNGIARPRGGHADAALHNGGNTASEFTSWTTDASIAREIAAEANGPGTVLRIPNADGPGYVRVPSPDIYGEAEVLIRGPVMGADVLPWEPSL